MKNCIDWIRMLLIIWGTNYFYQIKIINLIANQLILSYDA